MKLPRQQDVSNGVNDGKFYHIFDLPHQIEFGGGGDEAVRIMTPYSEYMKPLQVIAPLNAEGEGEVI